MELIFYSFESIKLMILETLNAHFKKAQNLLTNAGWLVGTEITARLSRIFTVMALAASFSLIEYGTAILAIASHEIIRMLLRSGTGAQIVQCAEEKLKDYCQNAMIIQWIMGVLLTLIQLLAAFVIGEIYQNKEVMTLIAIMSTVYLFYPLVSVKIFLLHRENKLRYFSIRNALCIIIENVSLAILAIAGYGIISVALSKLFFCLCWVGLFYFSPIKGFGFGFHLSTFRHLWKTSVQLMGSELSRALRFQADIFIAGKLISPELFGLYSFAKTAGVGLTQSLSSAFTTALYPYLCNKHRDTTLKDSYLFVFSIATIVGCFFLIQAVLVPVYVPLLFGEKWVDSHMTIALLCLTALPVIWLDTLCCYNRAQAKLVDELKLRILSLTLICLLPLLAIPQTPEAFAFSLLLANIIWMPIVYFDYLLTLGIQRVRQGKLSKSLSTI